MAIKLGAPIEMSGPALVRKGDGDLSKVLTSIGNAMKLLAMQKPPVVNVEAPVVTVSPAPPKPVKWKFTHTYDARGNLTETIAEPVKLT